MKSDVCSTSAVEEALKKLRAHDVAGLYDMTVNPEEFKDWPDEIKQLRELLRRLWGVCLSRLVQKLVSMCHAKDGHRFRDHLFEALLAKKMLDGGAILQYEPRSYGKNPPDFILRLGGESALVECGRYSADWFRMIENKVRSALRRSKGASCGVKVLLWTPKVLDRQNGGLIENELPKEVAERAERVKPGSEFEGKLVEELVVVRVLRTVDPEPSSVCWDWDRPGGNWGGPEGLTRKRLIALCKKATEKLGGVGEADASDALRILILAWAGAAGRLKWMRKVIRDLLSSDKTGREASEYLDAVVFARRPNAGLVEKLQFGEPIIATRKAKREERFRELLHRLRMSRDREDGRLAF